MITLATLVLAGIAVFTAIRLYNLRQESVAPTAPSSKPAAAGTTCGGITGTLCPTGEECIYSDGTNRAPTSDASGTCQPITTKTTSDKTSCSLLTFNLNTATATSTATSTSTSTATATATESPTEAPTSGPTEAPTGEPSLPVAGVSLPTLVSAGVGILLMIGSFVLIF